MIRYTSLDDHPPFSYCFFWFVCFIQKLINSFVTCPCNGCMHKGAASFYHVIPVQRVRNLKSRWVAERETFRKVRWGGYTNGLSPTDFPLHGAGRVLIVTLACKFMCHFSEWLGRALTAGTTYAWLHCRRPPFQSAFVPSSTQPSPFCYMVVMSYRSMHSKEECDDVIFGSETGILIKSRDTIQWMASTAFVDSGSSASVLWDPSQGWLSSSTGTTLVES